MGRKPRLVAILGILTTLILLGILANSFIKALHKKSPSSLRIPCHKSTTTFEKILDAKAIKPLQKSLNNGNFSLHITPLPSKYMKSKLFQSLDIKNVEDGFLRLFPKQKNPPNTKIELFIYENDKLDPNKKNKKSKLYEGYLLFNFSHKNNPTYKIQLDFYEKKGKDMPELLQCAKKSALSL